jgi:hypothetical protein
MMLLRVLCARMHRLAPLQRSPLPQADNVVVGTRARGVVVAVSVAVGLCLPEASLSLAAAHAAPRGEAAVVAFVESTSELDDGKSTSMWNAVDENNATLWCSQRSPAAKEALSFVFSESATVTSISLVLPPGVDDATDKKVRRPRVVVVADAEHRVEFRLKDITATQVVELPEPAKGRRIVVELVDTFAGADVDAPVCVGGVQLRDGGRNLVGAAVAAKARGLPQNARRLLREWHDDLSAPSRTLLLSVDGTFQYSFVPLLEEKPPVKFKGRWRADGDSLSLDARGRTHVLKVQLTKLATEKGASVELALAGNAPDPSMATTFHPAPLLHLE